MPDDSGYEAYVRYLYDNDIAPVVSRYRATGRRHMEWDFEFEYPLAQLSRANAMLRAMAQTPNIYDTFRAQALEKLLRDTAQGVRANSSVLGDLGIADVIDREYSTIARGMRPEHLPPEEADLLRRFGFPDVADHLPGVLYMVREHAEASASRQREMPPSIEMGNLIERLDQAAKGHNRLGEIEEELAALKRSQESGSPVSNRLDDEAASIKKPRRWWKGIGQIVSGVGISLGDAAVAVGLGTAGVAPAWGALISVTVGIGTAMGGIGDLRGE